MRALIRNITDLALAPFDMEVRRRHDTEQAICAVQYATVIDGGANIGGYAAKIRAAMPNAEIHSFEPTPGLFKDLQRRFAADPKTVCHEQALSEQSGTVTFHVTEDAYSSSLLEQTAATASQAMTVQAIALDDWANGRTIARPALLKLDVEGNELAALRGAQTLLQQIDTIELETTFVKMRHGQPEFREILNFLHEHGFDLVDVYPGMVDAATHHCTWADAVFERRARA